jgi:hypothetical protein
LLRSVHFRENMSQFNAARFSLLIDLNDGDQIKAQ